MKRFCSSFVLALLLSTFVISCTSGSSDSIYGVWKEYRADDPSDDYLISQLRFNQNGTGSFCLLDGGTVREKHEFTWYIDDGGYIQTNSSMGSSTYSFNNGLITENSAFGTIVYKKK